MAAKKKKRKDKINLLPTEIFQSSVLGRVLKWALTSFRVMVIVCELVVMAAFLSRFWLDARNSDLNEEINVAKAQVSAYKEIENKTRDLQKRLLIAKELYSDKKMTDMVTEINRFIPPDVFLNSVSLVDGIIQIKATSFSEYSAVQFIVNLESSEMFDEVSLGQMSSSIENENLITFTLKTKLK